MYPSYKQAILYRQPSGGRYSYQLEDRSPPTGGQTASFCRTIQHSLFAYEKQPVSSLSVTIYTTIRSLTAGMGMPGPLSIAASKDTNSR
ncbi:MAG: hypothetical protein LIP06_11930 [Tannerellaceae bacterium]|nr:hypothetical protein [Tannerellaceae bacterium]